MLRGKREPHVKAQDRYLPSFYIRGRYLNHPLPFPGRVRWPHIPEIRKGFGRVRDE
jgi:hypothetical protein